MSKKKTHTITFKITEDQYKFARRKLFVEDLTWQIVMPALLNAYIMGDVSITQQGRYHVAPPTDHIPVVGIEGSDVEVEPDWHRKSGKAQGRPQVGAKSPSQKPKRQRVWGTKSLAQYLRQETGRRISYPILRQLLLALEIPKADNKQWKFPGEENNEYVPIIVEAIENGTYDILLTDSLERAKESQKRRQAIMQEQEHANEVYEKAKRAKKRKQMVDIETQKERPE